MSAGAVERHRGERGFGLLLVVVVLAVLGLLSLSAFGVARRAFRSAREVGYAAEAFEAAESGLAAAASTAPAYLAAPPMSARVGPGAQGPRTRFTTTVIRLTGSVVLLRATGERLDGAGEVLARSRLGQTGKLVTPPGATVPRFLPAPSRGWVQLY